MFDDKECLLTQISTTYFHDNFYSQRFRSGHEKLESNSLSQIFLKNVKTYELIYNFLN